MKAYAAAGPSYSDKRLTRASPFRGRLLQGRKVEICKIVEKNGTVQSISRENHRILGSLQYGLRYGRTKELGT